MTTSSSIQFPHPMPPWSADPATMWAYLEEGVDYIMTRPLHTDLSTSKYMAVYNVLYNYFRASEFRRSFLYDNLIQYFVTHLKGVKDLGGVIEVGYFARRRTPPLYAAEWERYHARAICLDRLFTIFNYWVNEQRCKNGTNVCPVYTLALVQWKSNFFQSKHEELTGAILGHIERQRNGETDAHHDGAGLVKKVISSFVSLGLDEINIEQTCLGVYKEYFEPPLVEATIKYFHKKHGPFLKKGSFPDYLGKVDTCLREEKERMHCYLPDKTHEDFIKAFKSILAQRLLEIMRESRTHWVDFNKDEELWYLDALLSDTPDVVKLRKKFEEHVNNEGLAAVSKLVGKAKKRAADGLDLKAYVDALSEVHRKNSEMVTRSFGGEAGFVASLDKACREFVNRNAVIGTSWTKSPELLARYTDILLSKSKIAEERDLEDALNRVMILFKYIDGKDVFLTFYIAKLSQRLVDGVSVSKESEASMVSKLEDVCGSEYTSKLRSMLTDMSLSKDLTDRFRAKLRAQQNRDDANIKVTFTVLRTNIWTLHAPDDHFIVPHEILRTYNSFSKYYETEHPNRKLTWLWNYSKNELRTNYLRQRYILRTSSYQMAVLLQYNTHDSLSLEKLVMATAISKDTLIRVLSTLVKARILANTRIDQYELNTKFRSKKRCINLNLSVESSDPSLQRTVQGDRKHAIQATIVRIMKGKKTMKYQLLKQEVISQISHMFTPKVSDIKEAIDTLLESDYMERIHGERDAFAYMA